MSTLAIEMAALTARVGRNNAKVSVVQSTSVRSATQHGQEGVIVETTLRSTTEQFVTAGEDVAQAIHDGHRAVRKCLGNITSQDDTFSIVDEAMGQGAQMLTACMLSFEVEENDEWLHLEADVGADQDILGQVEDERKRLAQIQLEDEAAATAAESREEGEEEMAPRAVCVNCEQYAADPGWCPHCHREWCEECTTMDGRGTSQENCLQLFSSPLVGGGWEGQKVVACWECAERIETAAAGPPPPPAVTQCQSATWQRCDEERRAQQPAQTAAPSSSSSSSSRQVILTANAESRQSSSAASTGAIVP